MNDKNERKLVNSIYACSTSKVGKLYPHLANIFPSSVKDRNGEVDGDIPPNLSYSARFIQILSS